MWGENAKTRKLSISNGFMLDICLALKKFEGKEAKEGVSVRGGCGSWHLRYLLHPIDDDEAGIASSPTAPLPLP